MLVSQISGDLVLLLKAVLYNLTSTAFFYSIFQISWQGTYFNHKEAYQILKWQTEMRLGRDMIGRDGTNFSDLRDHNFQLFFISRARISYAEMTPPQYAVKYAEKCAKYAEINCLFWVTWINFIFIEVHVLPINFSFNLAREST